jgi:hypothetical protein
MGAASNNSELIGIGRSWIGRYARQNRTVNQKTNPHPATDTL